MRLLYDERGQSVQVGAAILLGFIVIAIAIYQAQVVPDQNADVEFNHNQEVRQDMIELRTAINQVENEYGARSVPVEMGTQYPPRSIFVNPPAPRGILRTEPIGNVSIENARVSNPDDYTGSGDPQRLLDTNHTTSHVLYRPDYAEFDGAATTYVEHSLAYDRFSNGASRAITPQSIVGDDSITLTILRGNLSQQGSGTFSVDPRTVSGPTEAIDVVPEGGPITLTLPTASPDVWNETFAERSDATVVDWNEDAETIRVALTGSNYDLRMAMVGVGNGVPSSSRYDVHRTDDDDGGDGDGGGSGGGAYSVDWSNPDGESANDGAALTNCDPESCTWNVGASEDNSLTIDALLQPPYEGIDVEFAVDDSSTATFGADTGSGSTESDGSRSGTVAALETGTVDLLASANADDSVLTLDINNVTDGGSGGGSSSADQVSVVSNSGGTFWDGSGVAFQLFNDGSSSATVSSLSVDSTSRGSVARIAESQTGSYSQGQHEVFIDAQTDGVLEKGAQPYYRDSGAALDLGSREAMTENAVIGAEDTATISLYRFRNNGGNPVTMGDESVTVTVHFADGSQATYVANTQ